MGISWQVIAFISIHSSSSFKARYVLGKVIYLDKALSRILEENGIESCAKAEHEKVLKEKGSLTNARHRHNSKLIWQGTAKYNRTIMDI